MKAFSVQCGAFGFTPSPAMTPQYITDTKAVQYFGNAMGGAWPHIDYGDSGAECQALTRLAAGIARQIGLPAWLQKAYIYADPSHGEGKEPIYHSYIDEPTNPSPDMPQLSRKMVKNVTFLDKNNKQQSITRWCYLNLITMSDPKENQLYLSEDLGLNQYEAVLSLTNNGDTFYYAGGAGLTAGGDVTFQRTRVLNIFSALVWWTPINQHESVIAEVVARYTGQGLL